MHWKEVKSNKKFQDLAVKTGYLTEKEMLVDLYKDKTPKQIAKLLGIKSNGSIQKRLVKYNIPRKKNRKGVRLSIGKYDEIANKLGYLTEKEMLFDMYKKYPQNYIARKMGISTQGNLLEKRLKIYNIPPVTVGGGYGWGAYRKPKTRSECDDGPCPFISCRHHMLWSLIPIPWGSGVSNAVLVRDFIDSYTNNEVVDMIIDLPQTCVLDLTDKGSTTYDEIGVLFGVTRQRVEQMINGDGKRKLGVLKKLQHPSREKYLWDFRDD